MLLTALTAATASPITFQNGSSFTAGTLFSGNAFGTTNLNSIVFANGSTYIAIAGSNPFGAGQPNSVVVFQSGSLFSVQSNNTPSFSGRTYANVEVNGAAANLTVTGGAAVVMNNLTITAGILNFNMTATPGHAIKGNISVASGATLNFNPASAGRSILTAPPQTVSERDFNLGREPKFRGSRAAVSRSLGLDHCRHGNGRLGRNTCYRRDLYQQRPRQHQRYFSD